MIKEILAAAKSGLNFIGQRKKKVLVSMNHWNFFLLFLIQFYCQSLGTFECVTLLKTLIFFFFLGLLKNTLCQYYFFEFIFPNF